MWCSETRRRLVSKRWLIPWNETTPTSDCRCVRASGFACLYSKIKIAAELAARYKPSHHTALSRPSPLPRMIVTMMGNGGVEEAWNSCHGGSRRRWRTGHAGVQTVSPVSINYWVNSCGARIFALREDADKNPPDTTPLPVSQSPHNGVSN